LTVTDSVGLVETVPAKRGRLAHAPFIGAALLACVACACLDAEAVPSFTRQTGLKCSVCHSNPPELTAFGRKFKLDGYTLTDPKADQAVGDKDVTLPRDLPLSAMLLVSHTTTSSPVPGTQGSSAGFPQALSLFLAGQFAPHLGGMIQATYSHESDHFSLDNTDIRYARHAAVGSKDVLLGVTLNNSPTVEDVWNSTPSWGYPWLSPNSAPSPSAQPFIVGALAQDVAGLGAYTLWNDHLYADVTLYRSEHAGGPQPLTGTDFAFNIQGVAPYWRLAWQQTMGLTYLEVGTYGMHVSSVPGGATGVPDTYTDAAVDLQVERPFGANLLTLHSTFIHERSNLNATFAEGGAATPAQHLNTWRADATYHLRGRYTLTVAGSSTTGNADPVLYAPAPVTGSALGSPNRGGLIGQVGYWPQQNIELSIAYTGYVRFNGASHDYDGSGRNASANNSVYVAFWVMF